MKRSICNGILMVIICLYAFPAATLGADIEFDYDIFWIGDSLHCWLDPTPALTQQKMEDLLAGLDIYFSFELKLERPRKLLFTKTLIKRQAAVLISHPLTEDIYQIIYVGIPSARYEFDTQPEMYEFLSDSLLFALISRDSLEDSGHPRLNLSFSCKSMNPKGILGGPESRIEDMGLPEDSKSTVFNDVFGFFLEVIGFGESTYQITTPTFNPDNLDNFSH